MRIKISRKLLQRIAYVVVVVGAGIGTYVSRDVWLPLFNKNGGQDNTAQETGAPLEEAKVLKLSPQARANLGLVSKPVSVQTYWRKIQIPGLIVDRPGITDREITSPIAGVITQVHALEGDVIRPDQELFTLRLVSEYLQKAQTDLFKAIRETEILDEQIERINKLVESGVVPGKRLIELNQQVSRQQALIESYRQELSTRGLAPAQIKQIEAGQFLTAIEVRTPSAAQTPEADRETSPKDNVDQSKPGEAAYFEVQELKVDLGQQVEPGALLAILANHNWLYVKGDAFKKEASNLAHAAENGWSVDVEFTEDSAQDWPAMNQDFQIRYLANTTDPTSRTFDFFIPLTNQSRVYEKDSRPFVVWRFRPGQRVRIQVPVEEMKDVIVLPAEAVVREGPEAYVFQQNGDLFNRISVEVIHQDRLNVVLANDGSLSPGFFLAQGSAASLNRVLKSQAASGIRADVHVHADGTTHAAH